MSALSEWITRMMTAVAHGQLTALLGLILIAVVMEIGLPVPFVLDSSLIFVAVSDGFLSYTLFLLICVLFIGRLIGSSILYWLGRSLGGAFIKWLSKRWPKLTDRIAGFSRRLNQPAPPAAPGVGLVSHLFSRLSATFRIPLIIVIARFTPGLLTVSSIAAGAICESYWIFILGIAISSVLADGLVLAVGFLASQGLRIMGIKPEVWQLVIGIAVFVSLAWGVFFLIKRKRKRG